MAKQSYTQSFSPKKHIVNISGIIGAGKSTLTGKLGKELDYKEYYEPVKSNEYLSDFYDDMKSFSFPMQIYLLNHRYKQHQQMVWSDKHAIQDRSIYEDVIFAKMLKESGLMSELDFRTYCQLFENMSNFLHRPDIIVYLDVEPEIALQRVKKRSRECESGITLEYLKDLKRGYEDWLVDISPRIPVIRIDWNTFKDVKYVSEKIRDHIKNKRGLIL